MAHSEFKERSKSFAVLGYYLSETARLEAAFDEFIFTFNEKHQTLAFAMRPTAPTKIEDKLDFYLSVVTRYHPLRREPIFGDGSLEINAFLYSISELFFIRNALAHGAIDLLEKNDSGVIYTAWRYVRVARNQFEQRRYSVGSGLLEELWHRGKLYRFYFQRLTQFLRNGENWEQNYQSNKQVIDNRAKFRELTELLGVNASDFSGVDEFRLVLQIPKQGAGAVE